MAKGRRLRASHLVAASLLALLLTVVAPSTHAQARRVYGQAVAKNDPPTAALILSMVRSGRMDDLRWPDFSDYRSNIETLYRLSDGVPMWVRNGRPTRQALQLIEVLQQADSEGLRPEDYDSSRWPGRLARLQAPHTPEDEIRFDVALTVAAMRYSSDLMIGRTKPRDFNFAITEGPDEQDLPTLVRDLASADDVERAVSALEPPFEGYRRLKEILPVYEQMADHDGEKLPPAINAGYPGPPYAGFERLCVLLKLEGDLASSYSVEAGKLLKYDPDLMDAVGRFQERHGLRPSGFLDEETLEQLNVPFSYRAEQIRLAMERFRWLRHHRAEQAILVNIPGFDLVAFDQQGKRALTMRVDVGEDFDNTRTPVMEAEIQYLIFRPYWDVPADIQRNEIAPAIEDTPDLSEFHYEAIAASGKVVGEGRVTQALLRQIRTVRVRIRQRPGPDNPMGLVKFVMPNPYNVYLHDTPDREFKFFVLPQRVSSHGCIHVEKPEALAAWLLRDQPQWTSEAVLQAMAHGEDSKRVNLSKPVPILIFYETVSTLEDGRVHFYRDIYGYDAELEAALQKAYEGKQSRGAVVGSRVARARLRPKAAPGD